MFSLTILRCRLDKALNSAGQLLSQCPHGSRDPELLTEFIALIVERVRELQPVSPPPPFPF